MVEISKPYAVGFSILEFSKLKLFEQYYDVFVPYWTPERLNILMSDTDSLLMEIKTNNFHQDLTNLKQYFDFSNFPPSSDLYCPTFKNITGLWKVETKGSCTITRFIGLKAKSYVYETRVDEDGPVSHKITCKGVNRGGQKQLSVNDYLKCIREIASIKSNVVSIRSFNHQLSTIQLNKLALSSFDDKRHLFRCGIHSSPYGSTLIHVVYNNYCYRCDVNNDFYASDKYVITDVSNE